MDKPDYDLFVIGAGSGGVRAARIAAGYGAKVAIAEEYRIGGTCVIRGCVPKKLLVYASRFADDFEDARGFGWTRRGAEIRLADADRRQGQGDSAARRACTAPGSAPPRSRSSRSGRPSPDRTPSSSPSPGASVTAGKILIATGGAPIGGQAHPRHRARDHLQRGFRPAAAARSASSSPAAATSRSSSPASSRNSASRRRSSIAATRSCAGSTRICAIASPRPTQGRAFASSPEHIFTRIEKTADGLTGHLSNGGTLSRPMQIMFAVGRAPNTAGLGLDKVGVELGWNGHVVVNEYSKSSVDSIFAVGDVTDRAALTPVAIREGHAFADTEFGGKPRMVEHDSDPDRGVLHARDRKRRPARASGARALQRVHVYKAAFRPAEGDAVGARGDACS